MLASQLIQQNYPTLHLTDKAGFALQLMNDYDVQHLPVVSEEKFIGSVAKEDLLDADEMLNLSSIEFQPLKFAVKGEDFILSALKTVSENELSLLPVVNETLDLVGTIPVTLLIQNLAKFLGTDEPGGVIVLEIERRHYSFGEISRLVETNDAYITQLNTYTESSTGLVIVCIKVNKVEISDILATFQRYDYIVRYYFGEENFANELKENYNHLMTYLNL